MAATEVFELDPPTKNDLDAAERAWRDGTIRYDLPAGEIYWRTLTATSRREALQYATVCFPSERMNRFSPLFAGDSIIASAYAANTETASLWESALRNIRHEGVKRVSTKDVRDRYLVQACTARDLTLLDIRRPVVSNIVAEGKRPPDLTAAWPSAYNTTRAWAQGLYDRIPDVEGLIYESHQVPGECVVLFPSGDLEVFEPFGDALPLNEDPVRSMLKREARKAGALVDFGELED